MLALLTLQFIALSLFPLYFTTLPAPMRQVHFYVYIALVLLIGGFMGNVYSVPIADGVVISGGNLCYGAFMMSSVMFVWIERDTFILRHLVRLVIFVNLFKIVLSFITQALLKADGVINPHNIPSGMFEASTALIVVAGVLIIVELLILLFIFESAKKKTGSPLANGAIYILSFILVLVLDGFAFSFIAFGMNSEIVAIVFGGILGKVVMATAFSIPLGLFMLWRRQAFVDYLESDAVRWRLLTSSSTALIREMARKDQEVRRGAAVFRNSSEGLAIVDGAGTLLKANLAFRKMLGISPETKDVNNAFWHANRPLNLPEIFGAQWRNEVTFGRDQQSVGILSIVPVEGESGPHDTHVFSLADISKQKHTQERLEYLVLHDQLTGLPNRRFLDQHLSGPQETPYILISVDLDRFRDINDSYGHGAGDRVLQVIGERLDTLRTTHLGEGDVLCNIGVDAFVFVVRSRDRSFVERITEDIQRAVEQTIHIDDSLAVFTTATIGVSYQDIEQNGDALLEANTALYAAKRKRRGSIGVYHHGLSGETQKKMELSLKLKNALAENLLDVHYQPQFDAVSRKLRGVEALVRWTDPELGIISPGDFIPVAEATGLIEVLGEYVLERACQDGQQWLQDGHPPITVSINVSASQLRFGRFASILPRTLERTGFPAWQLEIEITESSYIEREEEVTPLLHKLRDMGVSIAIDDFGTGYSSLSYLRDMPCDYIKIDRSFITDIPHDAKQCNLTSAIIGLAKSMSFKVVAEGVETKEQLDFLAAQGCDFVQGYYFAPALAKAKLEVLLGLRLNHSQNATSVASATTVGKFLASLS